jgi:predicted nucleic acid-binding protein
MADALIATTALEHQPTPATVNSKHFQVVQGLKIQVLTILTVILRFDCAHLRSTG